MKLLRFLSTVLLFVTALAHPLAADGPADAGWEKLKSLAGEWTGTADKETVTVSYRIVSSGTAVMETINESHAMEMVTVYHRDGSSLLMTHFCAAGNQPRMRSTGLVDGKLAFAFVDVSNLKTPADEHISGLVMSFPEGGALVQEWSSRKDGKESSMRFLLNRKK